MGQPPKKYVVDSTKCTSWFCHGFDSILLRLEFHSVVVCAHPACLGDVYIMGATIFRRSGFYTL